MNNYDNMLLANKKLSEEKKILIKKLKLMKIM